MAECIDCDGRGANPVPIVVPGCCGQPLEDGQCCGNPMPVQDVTWEACATCEGLGRIIPKAEVKYQCVNAYGACGGMTPGPACPYCAREANIS